MSIYDALNRHLEDNHNISISSITKFDIISPSSMRLYTKNSDKPTPIENDPDAVRLTREYFNRETLMRNIWAIESVFISRNPYSDLVKQLSKKTTEELQERLSRLRVQYAGHEQNVRFYLIDLLRTQHPDIPTEDLEKYIDNTDDGLMIQLLDRQIIEDRFIEDAHEIEVPMKDELTQILGEDYVRSLWRMSERELLELLEEGPEEIQIPVEDALEFLLKKHEQEEDNDYLI